MKYKILVASEDGTVVDTFNLDTVFETEGLDAPIGTFGRLDACELGEHILDAALGQDLNVPVYKFSK